MKTLLTRPPIVTRHRRLVLGPRASVDPVELSKTVGKGLTLWVLFTSTLNWMYYRDRTKK